MKKMLIMLALAVLLSISVPASVRAQGQDGGGFQAGDRLVNQAGGGYTGGGATPVTVTEALKMPDDAWVTLTGKIDRRIGDDKYQFSDSTGNITVEIDDEDWRGLTVGPNDLVLIQGEVDRDFSRREIDVKHISKK